MKTDILIPNPIFEAIEQLSQRLGISRNELYIAALTAYLEAHQDSEVTMALNQVYGTEPSTMPPGLVQMQVVSIFIEERCRK